MSSPSFRRSDLNQKKIELGVGMLGYEFMGKAHTNAFLQFPLFFPESKAIPTLEAICGRSPSKVSAAARRFGYERYYTDWRKLVHDDKISVVDNGLPNNMHTSPCIEAAEEGKHLICEKPLGLSSKESKMMLHAAEKAHVKHMVGYNYRFLPAIRLMRELVRAGQLGKILEFRAVYLQDWLIDDKFPIVWRLKKSVAGTGALGDLGSHIIDLSRFLLGDVQSTVGLKETFVKRRPEGRGSRKEGVVDVDDAFIALLRFKSGAIGSIEASRFCAGRKNYARIELHGSEGSVLFNLERLNELEFYSRRDDEKTRGFRTVSVTSSIHPYAKNWWPEGHVLGWEHAMVHEMYHFFNAVGSDLEVAPLGATFEDGVRVDEIIEAITRSTVTRRWEKAS